MVGAMSSRVGSVTAAPLLLAAMSILLSAGCATVSPSPVTLGSGITVPSDELRPVDRCLFEAGFRATEVHPARSGANAAYSWHTTTFYNWIAVGAQATGAAMANCRDRFAPAIAKSPDELREIYDRWVLERLCLVSLGFAPRQPPSFYEFQASWTTGPWMPIDGVDFGSLGGEPRDRCGLEMLD